MDSTDSSTPVPSFREQMAASMAELQGIMARGASPTDDGRLGVRSVDVVEPHGDEGDAVQDACEDVDNQ
jgi:hypothetical protein